MSTPAIQLLCTPVVPADVPPHRIPVSTNTLTSPTLRDAKLDVSPPIDIASDTKIATVTRLVREATARLPTSHGIFRVVGYRDTLTGAEHVALIAGEPRGDNVLVRVHSECITGEAFGSLKCECGPQLDYALAQIASNSSGGIVCYLRGQEGRGIGLLNKLKAYALQDMGLDTVDANLALGLPSEAREYGAAVEMLRDNGVTSVRLMTNNPAKREFLEKAGMPVVEYVPVVVGVAKQNEAYLSTKRERMGHLLPAESGSGQ